MTGTKGLGEEYYSSLKGKVGVEKANGRRDIYRSGNRNAMVRPEQQKPGVSGAGVNVQANNGRRETTIAVARRVSTVTDSQIEVPSSWVMDRESSGFLGLKQRTSDLVGKSEATISTNEGDRILLTITPDIVKPPTTMIGASGQTGTESELIYSDPVGEIEVQRMGSYSYRRSVEKDTVLPPTASECVGMDMENGFVKSGNTDIGQPDLLEIDSQALEVGSHKGVMALASSTVRSDGNLTNMASAGKKEIRQHSAMIENAGLPTVGAVFRNPAPGVVSPAKELSNSLRELEMKAGGSGLALNDAELGSSDQIVGDNGGRLLGADEGVSKLTLMRSPRRGKISGPDPLNGSYSPVEQNVEYDYGCFGSPGERNMCIGAPVPLTGEMSHTEQNGRYEVEKDVGLMGKSEARNRGNSSNIDYSGTMGNGLGGNIVVRNGDSIPMKSWKNLFSVPTKSNGQLLYSKPHRNAGKIVVKPYEEAALEGIDMWKGCLVGQFLDKRLPFPVVRSLVNKLWGKKEIPDISMTDNGLYFFRFRDLDARDWVMEYGPWHLAGRPFILRAWRPGMDMLNIQLSSIPIWVKFYNIPLEYWTNTSLGYIASVVGNPLHLDTLTENQSKLSFARICIEVGVDCEFPKSILLDLGNGKYSTIRIEYPWAPQCCSNCKLFGHTLAQCLSIKKQVYKVKETVEEDRMAEERRDIMVEERRATQDTGVDFVKDPPGVMDVDTSGNVVDSIDKNRGTVKCGSGEVNETITGIVVHPKLPGNTFKCLAISEEECPSEVVKIWIFPYQTPKLVLISRILPPRFTHSSKLRELMSWNSLQFRYLRKNSRN